MKKIYIESYGSVDELKISDVGIPKAGATQIVVKVKAFSINHPDIVMRQNGPFPTMPEAFRPKLPHMLGQDFSGVVTEIGEHVTNYQVGDHIYGFSMSGTNAAYLLLESDGPIAKVSQHLDLIPLGGFYLGAATAWSAVIAKGKLKKDDRVLIHGGAGGVGSMAIQIAKHFGAYVITTARASQMEYLKSLGANEVIDYQTEDFTLLVKDIDLVVNLTGTKTLEQSYQVVKKGGRITSVNGLPNADKAAQFDVEAVYALGDLSEETRHQLTDLYEKGILKVSILKEYPFELNALKQAHNDFEHESNTGKRIVVIED
ncbi:TPA: NADP-dependent oxidoreductase [Staphylococcus aureus]|nr:NADP-dependent oxidoreductase [Staphylococcus aureus]HDG8586583.1 NADP-dependent oxidoreductase [Staphylococcus aureus]HDZ3299436.1 NADP-dependent oxidoreductase [Staphylococcus aureus]HDZ3315757.1 NADP-dependent oxidoreductase [Staphylococcus aureus]HDZ3340416.1 NADP-dependent oxidoreductase [Staphylococcus aureus]